MIAASGAWFIVHEPARLTIALVARGEWRLIRHRQVGEDWLPGFADLLEREALHARDAPAVAVVCSPCDLPRQAGRFVIQAGSRQRGVAMVLN
jgi:hypothetical protein